MKYNDFTDTHLGIHQEAQSSISLNWLLSYPVCRGQWVSPNIWKNPTAWQNIHYRNCTCTQMHWHMAYITWLMNKHEWKQLMINVKYLMRQKHKTQLMLFCVIWIILQNTKIIFATTSFLQWQSNWFLLYQHRNQLTTSGCCSVCCDAVIK